MNLSNSSDGQSRQKLVEGAPSALRASSSRTSLFDSIFLCGRDTGTPFADPEKRIKAFETQCLGKLLCISYLEHKTKMNFLVGPQEPLLATIKRRSSGMSHATTAS